MLANITSSHKGFSPGNTIIWYKNYLHGIVGNWIIINDLTQFPNELDYLFSFFAST
jgi:hypothetical protein